MCVCVCVCVCVYVKAYRYRKFCQKCMRVELKYIISN